MQQLKLSSPAFQDHHRIPEEYSCEGPNPPLTIDGIPTHAVSLALVVDDPDAPGGTFDHWVIWNITPTAQIAENTASGVEGLNSDGENRYTGPCPPRGKPHRYFFKLYALDTPLELSAKSTKRDLERAMVGHVLAESTLVGLFSR
jgi:Raf kinase inhibitor-like YbhB/YbcL family protein